jgi:type VI secretion system protein VasD
MQYFKLYRWLWMGVLVTVLSACTSLNTKVGKMLNFDTDLTLTFKVDADINPDDQKTPSPLFIRMYELKSTKLFDSASFLDLFERDKETLGADMIAKQRLKRIKPGEDTDISFVLDAKTQFIGLYAEFSEYKNSSFKVVIPIASHNVVASSATIHIAGNALSVLKE